MKLSRLAAISAVEYEKNAFVSNELNVTGLSSNSKEHLIHHYTKKLTLSIDMEFSSYKQGLHCQ